MIKVEPAERAYKDLGVRSVITGRRASQGADRANLQPLEVDTTGLLKLNPLFAWSFNDVDAYIKENNVPHNALLDQGYKSVGDWHSTEKSKVGDTGERAGRWAGKEKTECGLHEDYFKMKEQVRTSSDRGLKFIRSKICTKGSAGEVTRGNSHSRYCWYGINLMHNGISICRLSYLERIPQSPGGRQSVCKHGLLSLECAFISLQGWRKA